jgi:hypothetical protein
MFLNLINVPLTKIWNRLQLKSKSSGKFRSPFKNHIVSLLASINWGSSKQDFNKENSDLYSLKRMELLINHNVESFNFSSMTRILYDLSKPVVATWNKENLCCSFSIRQRAHVKQQCNKMTMVHDIKQSTEYYCKFVTNFYLDLHKKKIDLDSN